MTLVYLSSPYSHDDPAVREERYHAAMATAASLVQKNFFVISPIVHWHSVALAHQLPTDFEFWKLYNEELIKRCDAVFLLAIPGWEDSVGVAIELQFATKYGKPVSTL
jgi:hypothetical protein